MQDLIQDLREKLVVYEKALKSFSDTFQKDPFHTLEWAADAFQRTADRKLCKEALAALEKGVSVEHIRSTCLNATMNGARFPKNSTSPTMNFASQCWTTANADMVVYLDSMKKFWEE